MTILTARQGTNADQFPDILKLHVPEGSRIADVTYGRGVFWKNVDHSKYELFTSDLMGGTDFRSLPFVDGDLDALVLDPPYMHGGSTIKESINKCYRNENTSHESVIRLYTAGILEAARVLKKQGVIIVKCQDEIESGKQFFSHSELVTILQLLGFAVIDLFVLVQQTVPTIRFKDTDQKSARKNHSYALVARFRR